MLIAVGDGDGAPAWTVTSSDGRTFAVFRLGDRTLRVTQAACPHNGGPLVEGRVGEEDGREPQVACPWHWYRFSLDDGRCRTVPCRPLTIHPVVDVDGEPHAEVGDPAPVLSWSERLRAHAREDRSRP